MCHAEQGLGNRLVSVQPYVCRSIRPQQWRAAGLLLSAVQAEDIDRQRRAATQLPGAAARRSISSKCGQSQSHVDSRVDEADHRLVGLSLLQTVCKSKTDYCQRQHLQLGQFISSVARIVKQRHTHNNR